MGTKRVPIHRRRKSPQTEAKIWATAFESRWDFYGELDSLGFPPDFDRSDDFIAAAEDAWHRLGAIFLANRDPSTCNSARPWALEQFGEP